MLDHAPCDLTSEPRLPHFDARHPVVQHEDDEPASLQIVRGHIRTDVAHPRRRRLDGIGYVDLAHRDNRLRCAPLTHSEISRRQAANRPALSVQHEDVELHDIDAAPEHRLRRGRRLLSDEHETGATERPREGHDTHV